MSMNEIRHQIYNEFHEVSLTDRDVLEALDVNPDYTLEINFAEDESVGMFLPSVRK